MDPLDAILKAVALLETAQRDLEARLTGSQRDELRSRLGPLRKQLHAVHDYLRNLLDGASTKAAALELDAELVVRINELQAHPPKLQTGPRRELLNGHALGKLLLTELCFVAMRDHQEKKGHFIDDAGFQWESTGEWDALGI